MYNQDQEPRNAAILLKIKDIKEHVERDHETCHGLFFEFLIGHDEKVEPMH
jgi:hypothetical protein